MDEPTNFLDIHSANIIEKAIINFEGATIFVTHDKNLLKNVDPEILEI